jgi:hypothetical protein
VIRLRQCVRRSLGEGGAYGATLPSYRLRNENGKR